MKGCTENRWEDVKKTDKKMYRKQMRRCTVNTWEDV